MHRLRFGGPQEVSGVAPPPVWAQDPSQENEHFRRPKSSEPSRSTIFDDIGGLWAPTTATKAHPQSHMLWGDSIEKENKQKSKTAQ